ncbi:lipoprotein [Streptococcus equinus]|nr:lipoprotein [Streptococcus equinus]
MDGTYVLERFDEVKTLIIKDGTGQLETKKYDEKIDIDSVKVNVDKQIILIGDDMKNYQLDGNQLTLTEGDGSQDIYTKQ